LTQPDPAAWYASVLEQIFPGYLAERKRTVFEAWPLEPETQGGYSCPLPGQVTTVAPLLAQPFAERLVFAGEHACPAFFGYMEGALQSGAIATGILAADRQLFDAQAVPDALRAAVNAGA
jgi:monoamine oxidase